MTKLVDQFGTKYFAAHYSSEVKNFLKTVKEIDLAGARICRDVMQHLIDADANGVHVHDSEDSEREAYFEENRRRLKLREQKQPTTALLVPSSSNAVIPAIKSLSEDKLYSILNGRSVATQAFVFLVEAARPEIKIDLGSNVGEVFALIYDNLFPSTYKWKSFYVLVGTTFIIKEPPSGEYNAFVNDNIVVPTDFGNKCLFRLPEWDYCIDRITKIFNTRIQLRGRKIKDFL